jgi:hypothetical protein
MNRILFGTVRRAKRRRNVKYVTFHGQIAPEAATSLRPPMIVEIAVHCLVTHPL